MVFLPQDRRDHAGSSALTAAGVHAGSVPAHGDTPPAVMSMFCSRRRALVALTRPRSQGPLVFTMTAGALPPGGGGGLQLPSGVLCALAVVEGVREGEEMVVR